jgi:hypothetical protein
MSERFWIPRAVQRNIADPYCGKTELLGSCRKLDLFREVDRGFFRLAHWQRYPERKVAISKDGWLRE